MRLSRCLQPLEPVVLGLLISLLGACDGTLPDGPPAVEQTVTPQVTPPATKQNQRTANPGKDEVREQTAPATIASGAVRSKLSMSDSGWRQPSEPTDRENYAHYTDNPLQRVAERPVSTFSIDVDTGAYSNVRRILKTGQMPRHDAVRVEELINYFGYDYPLPHNKKNPFSISTEIGPTPWNKSTRLLQIGLKGYEVPPDKLPAANLVFLIDVSGSMRSANKLDLLKQAMALLARRLRAEDRLAIVVYAGASGVVLDPVAGDQQAAILTALEQLQAGGSTNGAAGIQLAYRLAAQSYIKNGINRVILCTDGDFNVGTVSFEALKDLIDAKRKSGITLTTLGFGSGNYNDHLMEQLADNGNGHYAYIDTLLEARKVLVEEMSATLQTIAHDVKIQIEFNPALVSEYRLIGYENRVLAREDFSNDKVDAGDIGAGHTVTALYEITLTGSGAQRIEPLRYGQATTTDDKHNDELAVLHLRYKRPGESRSQLQERVIRRQDINPDLAKTSDRYRFAAAVAAFGQLLRGGKYTMNYSFNEVLSLARNSRGMDPHGYRSEFLSLTELANTLSSSHTAKR
jgi:Ca-activated chloride channel family protein